MKKTLIVVVVVVALLAVAASSCGPRPTSAVYTEQRKVPFFRVLTYEKLNTWGGGGVEVILFEDEAGNCFITSGVDGGISVAPLTSCQKARTPNVEGQS